MLYTAGGKYHVDSSAPHTHTLPLLSAVTNTHRHTQMPAADHTAVFLPEARMPPLPSPPPAGQPALLRALCVWSAVISTLQLAFLIFFFIKEGHDAPPTTEVPLTPFPGQMLRLHADKVSADGVISWKNLEESALVEVSDYGRALTILKDGHYVFSLWMRLESCRNNSVSLGRTSEALLRGQVPPTCTVWLANATRLSASGEKALRLTLHPPAPAVNLKNSTRLDIFFDPMDP